MMARKDRSLPTPDPALTDAAITALEAEDLRGLLRDLIPWLDGTTHARLVTLLVDRAARSPSGWVPAAPSDKAVAKIVAFAEAAAREGCADPEDVDTYLRQGSTAFLGKDYRKAGQIFGALLIPLGQGDVDLGQDEMLEDALGVDLADCATQYVVCAYMTAPPPERAQAVLAAIDEVRDLGHFWEPLSEMEKVAVEPLPDIEAFLQPWRTLVEARAGKSGHHDWDTNANRWLRDVVGRMEGVEGLATLARSTQRAEDLQAWCQANVDTRDWQAALHAFEESADLVTDKATWRGEFLDGAALAAQELSHKDLPVYLERAWRESPSLLRLRRWLGMARGPKALKATAAAALAACPQQAHRQRSFLHAVLGDLASAAALLAKATGLGWSDDEHPGHLLFPLFSRLLGGTPPMPVHDRDAASLILEDEGPRLAAPEVGDILAGAGITQAPDEPTRSTMLKAMRRAAEERLAGVIENKRRRHYGHAAQLVAACTTVDAKEASAWVAGLRARYRRYPALQKEFDRYVGHR